MNKNAFTVKKAISFFLTWIYIAALLISDSPSSFTLKVNALSGLNSWQITEQMTIGWNLGNSLDCSASWLDMNNSPSEFTKAWGNPEPTCELIKTVKDCGFNTIRIPVTWYQHTYYDGSHYVIQREWLDYVKRFVDYAYDMDMFVILNIHHEEGWINVDKFTDDTLSQAKIRLEDIWRQLSEEFKNYDQHLIFEGMNEPRQIGNPNVAEWGNGNEDGGYTYSYLNQLNEVFVRTVRANGSRENKERLLMIPSYHATASKDPLMQLSIPQNAGNVAISVHAYEPYPFTMDASQSKDWPGYADWGGYHADYQTLLQNTMSDLKDVSDAKNAPIIIGEFGASDFGNTQARVNWVKDYISLAEQNGFVCVLWDNNAVYNGSNAGGENHGYINRSNNTVYDGAKPVLDAMMETVGAEQNDGFWDNVAIDGNWIEIKRFNSGKAISQWSGEKITNDLRYIEENYKIAVVYDGAAPPRTVLENKYDYAWYAIECTENEKFIAYYDFNGFEKALSENQASVYDIGNIVVQATSDTKLYGVFAVPVDKEIISVDIAWGEMSFTYTDGDWNVEKHTYDNAGWYADSENGNMISVKNNGNSSVSSKFRYTQINTEIQGGFATDNGAVADGTPIEVGVGKSKDVYLWLEGKPSKDLNNETVGEITVTIGE